MKRKFLEELFKNLEAEDSVKKSLIDSIMNEHGNDLNAEKAKTETVKNDLKVKEQVIEDLNSKIKETENTDIEAIKKEEYERGKAEASEEVENFKKTNALKSAIKGARDFDLVFSKLDKDKIKYNKNDKGEYEVEGLDEQVKAVKEKYSFLFEEDGEKENSDIRLGGDHKEKTDDNDLQELEEAMGIVEEKNK